MIRALLGGTETMRAGGVEYLPRQLKESEEAYARRLRSSFLYPALRHTVKTFVGRVLGQPIDTSGVVEPIRTYLEDADRDGNNLTVFARHVFFDAVAYGVSWIYVDRDPLVAGSTLADARRQNNRPYLVHVKCPDVIGWRPNAHGGIGRVRIREQVADDANADDWSDEVYLDQVRVIEPGRYEIFRPMPTSGADAGKWASIGDGRHGLDVVPLVPLYTEKTDFFMARPPLLDLAWLNIAHWQSYSDQRHIEHIIRVPILLGKGFTQAELGSLDIGADRMVIASNPAADITYSEHSGEAAKIGRADLEDLEDKMAELGAQIVHRAPTMETATKTSIDSAESGASLAAMSMALQDALNLAIYYMGLMLNIADAGEIRINVDIPAATEAVEDLREDGGQVPVVPEVARETIPTRPN